jgi:hypothetical protein
MWAAGPAAVDQKYALTGRLIMSWDNRSNRAKTVFRRTTGALAPRTSRSLETERTKKITQKTYGIVITQ